MQQQLCGQKSVNEPSNSKLQMLVVLMFSILAIQKISGLICKDNGLRCIYKKTRLVLKPLYPNVEGLRLYCISNGPTESIAVISDESDSDDTDEIVERGRNRKVRQHVNPLASSYQIPINLQHDWMERSFENPSLPTYVDIGCSKGTWALNFAQNHTNFNILGLEIRKPVVEECLRRKEKHGVKNVHYMYTNANIDLQRILQDINKSSQVEVITIQFPDPHFKKRHYKRRVVNFELVQTIATHIQPGKRIFIQSDVLDVTEDMVSHFTSSAYFQPTAGYSPDTLTTNPIMTTVQTEREIATLAKNMPVYRMMFTRNDKLVSSI
eukprot:gene476-889_t